MYSNCKLARVSDINCDGVVSSKLLCLSHAPLRMHLDIDPPYPRYSHNVLHTKNSRHGGLASTLTRVVSDLEPRNGLLSTSPLG